MKRLIILLFLFTVSAFAQSSYPHVYVFGGADLTGGGGYQPFSYMVGGMIEQDAQHVFWAAEGMFDGAKKTNDGTGQDSGYTERGHVWGGYRRNNWLYGAGISYSNLHTDLYSKHSWHPRVGLGKDIGLGKSDFRLYGEYVLPGTDHVNAVQGVETSAIFPSPRSASHWFFRERFSAYEFRNTFGGGRGVFSELQLTIMYRF